MASSTTPTLVVSGENSPPMFRHLAALLTSLLPDDRWLVVPAASHLMHVENPAVINANLRRFLGDVAGTNP